MTDSAPPLCFHCGQPTETGEEGPRLNRMQDGRPCPSCADRLLESLPSLVREVAAEIEPLEEPEPEYEAFEGDPYLPDEPA
jgi:hypothetical protein